MKMPQDITALKLLIAAPVTVTGKPRAAPAPGWAFGDVLAGLIQTGEPVEAARPDKDAGRADGHTAAREAAQRDGPTRMYRRERTNAEENGISPWESHLQAPSPREVVLSRQEALPQEAVRVAAHAEE
jgi:hypothetical protein